MSKTLKYGKKKLHACTRGIAHRILEAMCSGEEDLHKGGIKKFWEGDCRF